ncbi:Cysteine-rich RLK (RECEPTOR-like protein kinase) 8 [Theobroma cacao]|uniref:Cysteine-rich RLK (RECEPTOR-like protein kinase) 8 n=1 Tax=Theobroma cacao TaxID=3641 RepID=A0A061ECC7_THECC|nr:Cysteine-rich RLK (RECEPTOR-like protein kinase) 8 [Theobroma cacao]
MAVMSFLAGLPPELETVKSQILSSSEISSLHDTFTRVLRTESSSFTLAYTNNSALVSRQNNISDKFAQFSRYQESLKSTTSPITAIAESSNSTTCLISTSSKWVIDSGASDHMTDLMTKRIIGKNRESRGLYYLDTQVLRSIACSSVLTPFEGEEDDLLVYTVTHSVSTTDILAPDLAPAQPPIVHVYSRRPEAQTTCPLLVPSPSDPVSSDHGPSLHLPIALRKSKRHCTYPISSFVSYDHLSSSSSSFVASLNSILIPKTVHEALSHPGWRAAMVEEMVALDGNGTWDLVDLPAGKKAIGCKWVFAVKVNSDGSVARLKGRFVAKGYAQTYGVDYSDTFSPVAKLNSVRLFISMAATYDWPLHQLDIKNAFLHGDLQEEVYMEQPPGFVAQGECGKVCYLRKSLYGLKQSPRAWFGKFGKLGAKPYNAPMTPNLQLTKEDGELFEDPEKYRRLVGKLNYLTVTRPDIAYFVSVVNANWAGSKSDKRSTTGYCVFIGVNLVSWKSKKQNVLSRSSVESEYRAMAQTVCEVVWMYQLLSEVGLKSSLPAKLWCDNRAALHIASNPVFHERTKHIEIDCHFVHEKIQQKFIATRYIKT